MIIDKSGTMLQIKRIFPAPRPKVFAAWTTPELLKRWWGPKGATTPVVEMDLKVGGAYRFGMQFPGQEIFYVGGVYREVEPPQRVVFTWRWEQPDWDFGETEVTLEFHEHAEGTEVTLRHEGFPDKESCQRHLQGWQDFFDKFTEGVSSE
jgi:glutathione S-transferase